MDVAHVQMQRQLATADNDVDGVARRSALRCASAGGYRNRFQGHGVRVLWQRTVQMRVSRLVASGEDEKPAGNR